MNDGGTKLGSTVSLPLSFLLGVLFFLPWLRLSCGGQEVGKASGWQLMTGKMSATQGPATPAKKGEDPCETIKARPWFAACLILPIVALMAGLRGATDKITPPGAGKALLVVGAAGLTMMILAARVDYSEDLTAEMAQGQQSKTPPKVASNVPPGMEAGMEAMGRSMAEGFGKSIQTEATGVLWLSLVLYVLLAGCGVVNLLGAKPAAAAPAAAPVAAERRVDPPNDAGPPLGQTLYEPPAKASPPRPARPAAPQAPRTWRPSAEEPRPGPAETPDDSRSADAK